MTRIALTQGQYALVDDADVEKVSLYRWKYERKPGGTCYAVTYTPSTFRMHQVVLPAPPGYEVDHINGDGLDNQRSNLRLATHQQNCHNAKSKSRWKGVTRVKRLTRRPWQARIANDGQQIHLGYFPTGEEAAAAYDRAARVLHAEFARLNGIDTASSDNKRRRVLSVTETILPIHGRNGKRAGHVTTILECGHLIVAPLSHAPKIGRVSYCGIC